MIHAKCRFGRASNARRWGVVVLVGVLASACAGSKGPSDEELFKTREQADARRNLGVDHLMKGRTAMAIRDLSHALDLNPKDPEILHWLGEAYRRKGLFPEAEDYLLQSLELDPGHHDTRLNLSGLYIQMGRFEEAIEQTQILVDDPLYSRPWEAHTNLGWAQLQLGRMGEARANLVQALEFRQGYWKARLNLGILELREGHKLKAIEHFQDVLDRQVGGDVAAEASYRLGELYVSLGRRETAVKYFMAAVEQSPYGRWGKQSEEYLRLLH